MLAWKILVSNNVHSSVTCNSKWEKIGWSIFFQTRTQQNWRFQQGILLIYITLEVESIKISRKCNRKWFETGGLCTWDSIFEILTNSGLLNWEDTYFEVVKETQTLEQWRLMWQKKMSSFYTQIILGLWNVPEDSQYVFHNGTTITKLSIQSKTGKHYRNRCATVFHGFRFEMDKRFKKFDETFCRNFYAKTARLTPAITYTQ